jgi:GT2 family glycosyltransferase
MGASSGASPPRRPPGPSMLAFWESLLEPLVELLHPERIVEIGSDQGTTTRALLGWASSHGATVHVIDPKPSFDVEELQRQHPDSLVFHRALSLEVLPKLERVELALVDGDHNRYTVLNELRLLEGSALKGKALPPLVALHDVGWPYGRRDLYYDPETIPAEERRPFEHRGMRPDSDELVDDGLNPHLANAKLPAPEHSGVMGGIEDFLARSDQAWRLFEVSGQHGLGLLAAEGLLAEREEVRDLLERTREADFLQARVEMVERERIEAEIRRSKSERAARAAAKAAPPPGELQDQLDEAERRLRRLRRQRDAAEEREGELEDELVRERRRARGLDVELETAGERGERASRRLAELEEEAAAARAGAEEKAAALERAEAARSRLVADFEQSREALERTIDELRAQADTGRHAAAELREALEERGLELQRIEAEMLSLRATLGRAQAEAEVARSERAALERRLAELAKLHEDALAGIEPLGAAGSPLEREAIASFTREYEPRTATGVDPLALPSPQDRRGVLVGSGAAAGRPSVDVVVCVHNALDDVRRCLWSLVEKGSYPFHLIVVDDGSAAETTAYLEEVAALNPSMTFVRNASPPHGYTIAANLGMRAATADYVVLLNSDTIVTFGWLERIVACGESDEAIGILGPLSNAASHQSVPELREGDAWAVNPLPNFVTEDGLAMLLERVSPRSRPRLPFVNGFCYVVKRPVFEAIGFFDETHFASGYCEENDFSYRAGQAGFELAVVDDCYVFHAKSRSYTAEARKPIAKRNYEIFLNKHGEEEIRALVARLEADTSLQPLRDTVAEALSDRGSFVGSLLDSHEPLSVAFVLPGLGLGGSGGSHSIYQEAHGLRRLGVPARILLAEPAWERALATYEDAEELFESFAGVDDLAEKTAGADVISATHFKSVALVAALRERRGDFLPAYYVQDYEPFFTARDAVDLREARDSYAAIPDCLLFAKTHWLCNIVADRHGLAVAKVEPSLDTDLFRTDGIPQGEGPLRVAAMVRPRTPRRQPTATCAVLEGLQRRLGSAVEVVTFGCSDAELARLTGDGRLLADHRGMLSREQVAELLRSCDVFLDMSMYQAFGRTALEAMACGCAAVVPRLGGVWEFAVDGVNARAIDTFRPQEAVATIAELAADRRLLREMQEAGRRTAGRYSTDSAALSEYLVFSWEHARRFGADRATAR